MNINKNNKGMTNVGIIILIIVLIIIAGIYYVATKQKTSNNPNPNPNPSPNPYPTTLPQPISPGGIKYGPPGVITSSQTFTTDTTAIVSGSVVPNGSFSSYWFEYGTSADIGNKTTSQTVGSGYVSIGAPGYITGLSKDTIYYFRLVAENQNGRIMGAAYTMKTTVGNPPPVGSAPISKTLDATQISRNAVNLNGEVTPNNAITQYWFEYGKTANLGNTTAFVSIGDGSTKIPASVSISDLDSGSTYYFRINAQNKFGTVNGPILNFKTLGPPAAVAPSTVTNNVTSIGTSTAVFHGTVNPNGAETVYWFEYSGDSLLGLPNLKTTDKISVGSGNDPVSVKSDISDLNPNKTYYFRLVAENKEGMTKGEKISFKTKSQ